MPNSPQLPLWVSYLQALAVPFLAVAIAGFGAWITAKQTAIADEKLQLDEFEMLYNRRVMVYEATRQFLADVYDRTITEGKIQAYGLRILDEKFLFDEDVYKYLAEIRQRVAAWNLAQSKVDFSFPASAEMEAIASEKLVWITQQGDEQTRLREDLSRI